MTTDKQRLVEARALLQRSSPYIENFVQADSKWHLTRKKLDTLLKDIRAWLSVDDEEWDDESV